MPFNFDDSVILESEEYSMTGVMKGTIGIISSPSIYHTHGTYSGVKFPGVNFQVFVYDHHLSLVSSGLKTSAPEEKPQEKFVDKETMWKITQSICKGQ